MSDKQIEQIEEKELPKDVRIRLRDWKALWMIHTSIKYYLGILGILASSLGALGLPTKTFDATAWSLKFEFPANSISAGASVVAAVIFGVMGFVSPERQYTKFIAAWRTLDAAKSKYCHGLISLSDLLRAKAQGEQILANYERTELQEQPAPSTGPAKAE